MEICLMNNEWVTVEFVFKFHVNQIENIYNPFKYIWYYLLHYTANSNYRYIHVFQNNVT